MGPPFFYAGVAQLVEQRTRNAQVSSSSLDAGSRNGKIIFNKWYEKNAWLIPGVFFVPREGNASRIILNGLILKRSFFVIIVEIFFARPKMEDIFMLKEILLLRHGETDWNIQRRFQGGTDIPLNSNGERQAVILHKTISSWDPDTVWVSPLQRAVKTAELLMDGQTERITVMNDLREINFGDWEGKSIDILRTSDPLFNEWQDEPFLKAIPNSEPTDKVFSRVRRVLKVVTECDAERILIISHGGTLRVLLAEALGVPLKATWKNFLLSNCSLSGLTYSRGKFVLCFYNDRLHSYLAKDRESENVLPVLF